MSRTVKIFVRSLLWSLIIFSSLIIAFNIIFARYPSEILKRITDNKDISVGKVNTLFIPFFADISDLKYSGEGVFLEIASLRVESVWKNLLKKTNFINMELNGASLELTVSDKKSQKSSSGMFLNFLNEFGSENVKIKYHKGDNYFSGNISRASIKNSNFQFELGSGEFVTPSFKESFKASGSGFFNKKINIKNLSINGDSWYVTVENGEAYKDSVSGNIAFFLSENLLRLFNKNISGNIKGGGGFNNLNFNLVLLTDELKYNKHNISARIKLEKYDNNMIFSGEDLMVDSVKFTGNGQYNLSAKDMGASINFYDFKAYSLDNESLYMKTLTVKGNIGKHLYDIMLKGEFYGGFTMNASAEYSPEKISFKDINGEGSFAKISGGGVWSGGGLSGELNMRIYDAKFINKFIKDSHDFQVDSKVVFNNKKLEVKGFFKSLKGFRYEKVDIDRMAGEFDLTDKNLAINFRLNSGDSSVTGSFFSEDYNEFSDISLKGHYNISDNDLKDKMEISGKLADNITGDFSFGKIVPFQEGVVYFNLEKNKVSGKLSVSDNRIYIDLLEGFQNRLENPGYIDLKSKNIKISLNNAGYVYDGVIVKELSMEISGRIENPGIRGSFWSEYKKIGENRKFYVSGDLRHLTITSKNKNSDIAIDVKPFEKKLNSRTVLKNYRLNDNLSITSAEFVAATEDFEVFSLGGFGDVILNGNEYNITDIKSDFDGKSLLNGSLALFTPVADYVFVNKISVDKNIIRGHIVTDEVLFSDHFLRHLNFSGGLDFTYNIGEKIPLLYGSVSVEGDIKDTDTINSLKNINSVILFEGEKVSMVFDSKDLDSRVTGNLMSNRYSDPKSLFGSIRFENLFLSVANFNGTVTGNLSVDGLNISSELSILKGVYEFKPTDKKSDSKTFPLKLDLRIKTLEPVTITGFGIKSDTMVDLKLKYDNKLAITGIVQSVNTSFVVSGSKFNIVQGVLKFREDTSPYLYMNARGTGSLKNIMLNVDGFLPEYNIEVRDLSPNGVGIGDINQPQGNSSALIGSIFNGQVFSQIVDVTNKIFGINEIGIESNLEQRGSIFFGRRFSDRLGIKYVLKSDNKLNEVVGEYAIFDWLNFNLFTSGDRKTGAGISFYFNF